MQSNLRIVFWTSVTILAIILSVYFFFFKSEEKVKRDGCYIKTGLATLLLSSPDLFAPPITKLPSYKEYQVLEVKIIQHVGDEYLFLIKDEKLELKGWVKPFGLEYSDPACFK